MPSRWGTRPLGMLVWLGLSLASWAGEAPFSGAHTHGVPRFQHLPRQETVACLLQDAEGFLWLGGNRGLDRYDGYRFLSFRHDPFDPEGIGGGEVSQLAETADGDLWLVAGGVLNRYQRGTGTFVRYGTTPELAGGLWGTISVLFSDKGGKLWIGTSDAGLFRYVPEDDAFLHFAHNPNDRESLPSSSVSAVYQAANGVVWVATTDGGPARYNSVHQNFTPFLEPDLESYTLGLDMGKHHVPFTPNRAPITEDGEGRLWVITYGAGLIHLDPATGAYRQYQHQPDRADSLGHNIVFSQFRDRHGRLWLATAAGGLDIFDPEDEHFFRYRPPMSEAVPAPVSFRDAVFAEDLQGDVWIGYEGGVTVYCDTDKQFYTHRYRAQAVDGLSDDHMTVLFIDRADTLWLGTRYGGLNSFSYYKNKFFGLRADRPSLAVVEDGFIDALLETEAGTLWLATRDKGLFHYDPTHDRMLARYTHHPGRSGPAGRRLSCLLQDGSDLWVGSRDGGLARLDTRTGTWTAFPREVGNPHLPVSPDTRTLYRDPEGAIWVGTAAGGLHRYLRKQQYFERFPLSQKGNPGAVTAILAGEPGELWVAEAGRGLYRLNTADGTTHLYRVDGSPTGLGHDTISSMVRDRLGRLWLGTLGGGLHLFLGKHQGFQHFSRKSGVLPDNVVHAVQVDARGILWLSTDSGLLTLDPETWDVHRYDQGDGLVQSARQAGAFVAGRTRFYFAGRGDINRFDPTALRINPHPPAVALALGEDRDPPPAPGEVLRLPYHHNRLFVSFTALDFTYPEKNRYAYKLEGVDTAWRETREARYADYTSLHGGTYRFRLKAANNDGVWNEDGAVLLVQVLPPLWQTWWFHLLEGVAALWLIYAALRFQWRRLQRQKQEALLELDLQRKTQELDFARRVQLSMLPEEPLKTPSLDMVGKMRTATEVGGDYYDYFALTEHHLCFLLGDATGHGLAAGLAVGMTKMGAVVWSMGGNVDLEKMMHELNLGLKAALKERTMGMALGAGIIDLRTHEVTLTFAGMPFPYHYQAGMKRLKPLVMKSPPLGFMRTVRTRTTRLKLEAGDYLVLLSDGLPERFNPENLLWGSGALERRLARICRAGHAAEDVCRHLFDACDIFADGRGNEDDMTLLVLHARDNPPGVPEA